MSIVKDMSLAPSGRQKIQWVRDFMPALSGIEARFEREQPFAGLRIAVSVHLEAKTANLGLVLKKGGAQVFLTGCNPLSTQDDVAAAVAELGVETFGIHGVTPEQYEDLLVETLKCHPTWSLTTAAI
jgi:adenosylhomocysteinase